MGEYVMTAVTLKKTAMSTPIMPTWQTILKIIVEENKQ